MVQSKTGLTSTKRFGARYGRRVKELFENAERTSRSLHTCPFCRAKKVKRVAVGIWSCKKCSVKFTGKAYIPYEKKTSAGPGEEPQIEPEIGGEEQ